MMVSWVMALPLWIHLSATSQDASSMALGCRLTSYGQFQDQAWTHLPKIGVKHLFLSVPKPEEVGATLQRLQASGLDAIVLRGQTDLSQESAVSDLTGQLEVCQRMGARFMFLSAKRNGAPKEDVYARLRQAGDAAQKVGVTIVLETHPDLGTNGEVFLETMKAINHPNVRANFDTGNITYYNKNTDAVTELKKIIDYVASVDLKDHSGELEDDHFPVLGRGIVDFPGIFKILKEHGFKGPVTLEIEGAIRDASTEAQVLQIIEDSVSYARPLMGSR